jgi:hypothetical protein
MLPRFKAIDRAMSELFSELVFKYSHALDPIFSDIKTYIIHEGSKTMMKFGDKVWEDQMFEASAEYEIKQDGLSKFSWKEFHDCAREIGTKFLSEKKKNLVDTLDRVTSETGSVIDSRGKPLDHDAIFEALELLEINFDANGQPEMPSLMVHPDMVPRLEQLSKEAEESPALKRRHDELMRRKKEVYLAREADRKLVG